MKTNKMMRLASVLLVAVLLSTCAISGTFAKYVTTKEASDSARVAKFGVTITASGKTFAEAYDHEDDKEREIMREKEEAVMDIMNLRRI